MPSAVISVNTTGDNIVIAAPTSGTIQILGYTFIAAGTVNLTFENGNTAISGAFPLTAQTGVSCTIGTDPIFILSPNTAFVINLSASVGVFGHVTYTIKPNGTLN